MVGVLFQPVTRGDQTGLKVQPNALARREDDLRLAARDGGPSIGRGGPMNEGFDTDPGKLAAGLNASTAECCCVYNMLKLTEDLFRADPSAKYADFYERTLYNHILSTQHPVHGDEVDSGGEHRPEADEGRDDEEERRREHDLRRVRQLADRVDPGAGEGLIGEGDGPVDDHVDAARRRRWSKWPR